MTRLRLFPLLPWNLRRWQPSLLGGGINNTLTLSPVSSASTCEDSSVPVCRGAQTRGPSVSCEAQPVYQGKLGKQNRPQSLQLEMYVELVVGAGAVVRTTGCRWVHPQG